MKGLLVVLDPEAERDLDEIVTYIAAHDSVDKAVRVSAKIEQAIYRLESFASRGAHPRELLEYGIRDFREVHFKPYRILYRVLQHEAVVVLIADGRRDMRALLARRLLGA